MSEKLFVILEVEEIERNEQFNATTRLYEPVGHGGEGERLVLKPERIITEGQMRYEAAKKGDTAFYLRSGWGPVEADKTVTMLILDPAPEEPDEWDEWGDEAPFWITDENEIRPQYTAEKQWAKIIDWLKRMPRKE